MNVRELGHVRLLQDHSLPLMFDKCAHRLVLLQSRSLTLRVVISDNFLDTADSFCMSSSSSLHLMHEHVCERLHTIWSCPPMSSLDFIQWITKSSVCIAHDYPWFFCLLSSSLHVCVPFLWFLGAHCRCGGSPNSLQLTNVSPQTQQSSSQSIPGEACDATQLVSTRGSFDACRRWHRQNASTIRLWWIMVACYGRLYIS